MGVSINNQLRIKSIDMTLEVLYSIYCVYYEVLRQTLLHVPLDITKYALVGWRKYMCLRDMSIEPRKEEISVVT